MAVFILQTYHGHDFKSCLHRSLHNTKETIPKLPTIKDQYAKTTTASRGDTHLAIGTSGLKQKCTQTPISFLGTVFHALSGDVIHFDPRGSFKNLEMEVSDWLLKNFNQRESGFLT